MSKIRVFLSTVGEEITLRSLIWLRQTLKEPYELTVWYDLRGEEPEKGFLEALSGHTEDIVMSYSRHGQGQTYGWGLTYLDYDYFVWMASDFLLKPGWWEKVMDISGKFLKVGVIGEAWRESMEGNMAVNDFEKGIDGVAVYTREAINDVGSVCSAYKYGWGPIHQELHYRMIRKGWHVIAVNGLCEHGGKQHEGRDGWKDWEKELHKDNLEFLKMQRMDWQGYKWWSNRVNLRDEIFV